MTKLQDHQITKFEVLSRLWSIDRPLTATSLLMLVACAGALVGLWLDPRVITGAPAWLKPAKFGLSTAIYGFTLVWIFGFLPAWSRTRRIVGWTTAIVLAMEVAIIDLQAWRGTISHFNAGTALDGALFAIMGVGILAQTASSVAVAVALWRQTFVDRALAWALRFGMAITILGGASGGLMTAPTSAQMTEARLTHVMPVVGAHTVGAPDGGPGMPGTGWSTAHGDLRVPHFVGLHAMQLLPLLVVGLPRRLPNATRARLVIVAAASYVALFALLLWQAYRGESVLHPGVHTLAAFSGWAALSFLAAGVAVTRIRNSEGSMQNSQFLVPNS